MVLWGWVGLGFALLALEMHLGTLFCLWLAGAALSTALLVWVVQPDPEWQLAGFAVAAVVAVLGWQHFRPRRLEQARDPQPLNARPACYLGRELTLHEPLSGGEGRVRIDDTLWQARGADLPAGTRVKVDRVEGMVLHISALSTTPTHRD